MKKYSLGKGLNSLIPNSINTPSDSSNDIDFEKNDIFNIPINLIYPNSEQPRKYFDDSKIDNLSLSIKEHGIIQPLIVKAIEDNKYMIIAGERRWRAAKKLKLEFVPVTIMDLSKKDILEISLIENIQREDLNPIEEAIAYKKLLEEFNIIQEVLSNKIGKSRESISNKLRLLKLDKVIQEYLINDSIKEGHARLLLSIENKDLQLELANKIKEKQLSVRETDKLIKMLNTTDDKNKKINNENSSHSYIKDLKEKLENYFGTKVNVNAKKNKGKIEIEYYSIEDLDRILELLEL